MTEETLFEKARNLPVSERVAFLNRECPDPAMRVLVDAMLAADAVSLSPLDSPINPKQVEHTQSFGDSNPKQTESAQPTTEAEGVVIAGRYKLRQQIGEGGMGTVWMADQTEPVKRKVAVKLIRVERGQSKTILARFEAERQAIALMDHPHIAKLLDAGTTENGSPFFVMELVKGVPLNEYCDQHKLTIPERLNLFIQICSAVQHAHQKGIIHRDLKPGNILVESHDGKPVPKVIDFGLAKATTGLSLTEQSMFTAFGSVMGTPLYMAPEQATFNAVDVDTRADVYALGVILYELLTGTTPITRETLKKAALDEMLKLIREQEAPTPSSRLSSPESTPSIAASRQIESAKLGRFVKGELDWIVMKSLSKERDRRYESATNFARDIERFLNHEPVQAGPPSTSYRLKKFVRRNRGQVLAASFVLLALVAGVAGTTLGLIEARRQATIAKDEAEAKEKARQVAEGLANDNAKLAADEQEAKKAAIDAKQETERQLRRIQAVIFSNQMAKAGEVAPQNPTEATKMLYDLEAIPVHMRDAAWRLLVKSCEKRLQRVTIPDFYTGSTPQFSPDGTRASVRNTRDDVQGERVLATITIHDVFSGKVLFTIPEEQDAEFTSNAFSSDGSKFVQFVDPKAKLKPVDPTAQIPEPRSKRYLPGGEIEVRVWDVPSAKIVFSYTLPHFTGMAYAFSPDGHLLAATDANNSLRISDIAKKQTVTTLKGYTEPITNIAISRDGKRIATGHNDFTLKLWDGTSGEQLFTLTPANDNTTPEFITERKQLTLSNNGKPPRDYFLGLDFNADGTMLATSYANWLIEVWDVAKGKSKDVIRGLKHRPGSVAFDATGKSLFVGGHSRWEIATGQMMFTLNLPPVTASASRLLTNPERTRWGTLQGRRITWVNPEDSIRDAAKFTLTDTPESIQKVAFSPDNQLIAIPCGNCIEVIDRRTGKLMPPLTGPRKAVSAVTFSPDGRILAASCRGPLEISEPKERPDNPPEDIYLFDMPSGKLLGVLPAHENEINSLEFSPDGQTLASVTWHPAVAGEPAPRSERHALITLWDVITRKRKDTFEFAAREPLPFGFSALRFHPKNGTLAAAAGETVIIWDLANRTHRSIPITSSGPRIVGRLDFSADGDTVFIGIAHIGGSATPSTLCVNLKTGETETRFLDRGNFQHLTPDGKTAVLATQTKASFFNAHTLQHLHTFNTGTSGLVAVAPDCRVIAAVEQDRTKKTVAVKVWDMSDPERVILLPLMSPISFSPDSKTLVASRMDTYYVWDLQTYSIRRTVPTSRGTGGGFKLSPDTRFVATTGGFGRTGQEGSIDLFDLTTGSKLATIPTGKGNQTIGGTPMVFSPDCRTLAFVHKTLGKAVGKEPPPVTGAVKLWDVQENRESASFSLPVSKAGTFEPMFSPDGRALAVIEPNGAIYVFDLRTPDKPVVLPTPTLTGRFNSSGVRFTPDGNRLVARYNVLPGPFHYAVWDWRTAKLVPDADPMVGVLFPPGEPFSKMSPDGHFEVVSEIGGHYLIDRKLHPKK